MQHKVTERLLNYLERGDEVDRCYAAKTLGNLKVTTATNALLERIKDEDIDVCIDAIYALGKIKDFSAIPLLLESLEKDPDEDVKLAITESLAHFQSQDAIDILLKLAEDRPEEMDFDQNADWDGWWDLQEKAIVILGEMKVEKAFPMLKNVLEDEFSQDIEAIVLKSMAKIGGEADEYLINRLNNSSANITEKHQRRTATALGFSDSKETLQALGRALLSKSAQTRENVLYALGKRKASQYVKAIIMSLRDADANVKQAALTVLQQLATEAQINKELDFDQVAAFLSESDIELKTAVLSFFIEQQKINPVINNLSDENQLLIQQCLLSSSDKVLTQASQLAGISRDAVNLQAVLNLALSESHSVWVRKEAVLALGAIINSADSLTKQDALLNLRTLVHHNEQAIRFAALHSLLTLSNESPPNEQTDELAADVEPSASKEPSVNNEPLANKKPSTNMELPPISILLATLKGEQFSIQPDDDGSNGEAANDIEESTHLIADHEDQPMSSALSTLEAIAMDNVDSTLSAAPETAAQKSHNKESGPFITEDLPEELDEFVEIMRKNFSAGKKIVRRKVETSSDTRHICARLLSDNIHEQYNELIVSALAECLNDEDEQLRQEAAEALSLISLRNPVILGLSNTFGKLVTLLDSKDADMRIACIHAISHSGNPAALPHLLDYLSDEEYIVRLQAIDGLVYILKNKAQLNQQQKSELMIIDEVKPAQVIAEIFKCLEDKDYSVSMKAIEALTELQQTGAIERFVDVALKGEGQSARRISKLLKTLDLEKSTEVLLTRLDNVPDSSYRRYVMEMLEVVMSPDEEQKQAA